MQANVVQALRMANRILASITMSEYFPPSVTKSSNPLSLNSMRQN